MRPFFSTATPRLGRLLLGVGTIAGVAACSVGTATRMRPDAHPVAARATTARVAIELDGRLDDWAGVPLWTDAAPSSGPLQSAWATDDPHWWYVSFSVRDSVSHSAMAGTLHVLIDVDDNISTGGTVFDIARGLAGVDLSLDLSRSDKPQANGVGAGAALRTVEATGAGAYRLGAYRSAYDLGVVALPTWSATRFELRIARGGTFDGFARLGRAVRARLVFESATGVVTALPAARYVFATASDTTANANLVSAVPAKTTGSVRVAQWNVSEGSFKTPANHAKLLAAVAPDVILLDEAYAGTSDSTLADFFARAELAALGTWRFVYSRSGGRQHTVVATRDRDIRQASSMVRVEYPAGVLDSVRATALSASQHLFDIEVQAQISSTGAWITIDGIETLFVPLDLQSGGFFGNAQDQLRVLQSRAIRAHVQRELASRATRGALVIAGDFNAIGSYESVHTLRQGLDVDGSDLTLSDSWRLGERTLVTWTDPKAAQFLPGRLDLTLYADAVFERTGGFAFTSADLAPAFAASLGLTPETSARTADHLIVVTDLRRRR
ncbi:endonuclease/exonuclease/phosphatase family protein [Gemmatimonas sp.]|uniref:endonuclease/exonuclease/phosphatase family protein n=1 Tax=Gemmatimonas sp. TaxID=1962908 RepID=UPI003565DE3D